MKNVSYEPRIGDFVARLIDADWVITGVIVGTLKIPNTPILHKICWSPIKSFPVTNKEFYETYENIKKQQIVIIRNEQDIPSNFLAPN